MEESESIYERVIVDNSEKNYQIRLTVNEFREIEYLHLRRYYLDFDETWKPSNEGIAFPIELENSQELLIGLLEILSLAESKELIQKHFSHIIEKIFEY